MNWQAWHNIKRGPFKPVISPQQEKVLAICFGSPVPDASKLINLPTDGQMNVECLQEMARMTLIEFSASIHKERWKQDVLENREPNPFDVFVIKASGFHHRDYLAVVLPLQKNKGTMWYDGRVLQPLDELAYKGRIANLAGPARVLEALPAENAGGKPNLLGLSLLAMERSFLAEAPTNWKTRLEPHQSIVSHLNDSQKSAVAAVASPRNNHFKQGFFVVQGPPGCGKTTTIVAMITAMKSGVLVVAPSNAALANIALKLYSVNRYNLNEIVAFGRNSDPSIHFLNPLNRGEKFRDFRVQYDQHKGKPARQKQILQECKEWLHLPQEDSNNSNRNPISFDDVGSYCPYINLDQKSGRSKLKNLLGQAKIIFSTLNSSGSRLLQSSAKVHTALFDEAGQASEADFYILTNFPGIQRIALVGDPMQLPTTVLHQKCQSAGYGESWMKRVYQRYPDKVHLLNTQYRMDPKILFFPNETFYCNRIQSGDNVFQRNTANKKKSGSNNNILIRRPFQCIDTCGQGKEQKCEMSWKNDFEVEAIRVLLQTDPDIQRLVAAKPNARIIIITPYRAQVKALLARVTTPHKQTTQLNIATIDSFQGQEGDIVIFSTVRTKRLGFVDDGNRLNVAITRAKRILRVIGDANFFVSKNGSFLARLFHHAQATESMGQVQSKKIKHPVARNNATKRRQKKQKNENNGTKTGGSLPPPLPLGKAEVALQIQPSKRKRRRRRKKKPGNP